MCWRQRGQHTGPALMELPFFWEAVNNNRSLLGEYYLKKGKFAGGRGATGTREHTVQATPQR